MLYRLRYDWVTLAFGVVVLGLSSSRSRPPLIAPFDPYKHSIVGRLKPFGWRGHPLGTDELGRDMLSRLIYGGRISLLMGLVPVLIATLIGGTLGVIGGFAGRLANTAIMRTMDVFYAFPSVLLAVAISGAHGRRHRQWHHRLDAGVHSRHLPRGGDGDRADDATWTSSRRHAPAARVR